MPALTARAPRARFSRPDYFDVAVTLTRQHARTRPQPETHWYVFGQPTYRGRTRAACGQMMDTADVSPTPVGLQKDGTLV